MPHARLPGQTEAQRTLALEPDTTSWQVSDGVLFSVLSSLVLWSLIVAGLHATLT